MNVSFLYTNSTLSLNNFVKMVEKRILLISVQCYIVIFVLV